ncbi:MAG: 50S ribosomal protein L25 [Candidatus Woesebacteria bacterium GW2011_GWB1_39_12]|uniref:Large ribosomal subunit protein bL25 n=2 Tax=Candidatus Woeseibacteriota TaxID=1752722 RepID=A0A0G0Q8D8_9BACT|nr:MAG: 50S ribosomal protein L25 [Candidatus Woesebacteria bacterium GW2011_GWA1_39_12]KKR00091.1 MAG: 50S ribosomal protein L25 [Candidatus Woesebacteria bacterium GW2011_GWB1_39_12]
MNKLTLKAEKRKVLGRKVKKLRRDGILPGNLYGKKVKSEALQIDTNDFLKTYKEAGETGLLELVINGDKRNVLIHNVQLDPVNDTPLHADFMQVDLKQKVTAEIPIELVNESPAEKQGLGTVVQYINEIEVAALPTDLLDKFEIDISKLTEVDQSVFVRDLMFDPKKVEIKEEDLEKIIVKVEPPRKEEVVAPPPEAEISGEEVQAPAAEAGEEVPSGQKEEEKKEETVEKD